MYQMVMGYHCDVTMLIGRLTLSTGRTELKLFLLQLLNIFPALVKFILLMLATA